MLPGLSEDEQESEEEDEAGVDRPGAKRGTRTGVLAPGGKAAPSSSRAAAAQLQAAAKHKLPGKGEMQKQKEQQPQQKQQQQRQRDAAAVAAVAVEDGGFEEVPMRADVGGAGNSDVSDSDEDSDAGMADMDDNSRAEVRPPSHRIGNPLARCPYDNSSYQDDLPLNSMSAGAGKGDIQKDFSVC
jgi:hypothetical protein